MGEPSRRVVGSNRLDGATDGFLEGLGGEMQSVWHVDDAIAQVCRDPRRWDGSYYEMAVLLSPGSSNEPARLDVLRALWRDPQLRGVVSYPRRRDLGREWQSLDDATTASGYHYYGFIRLNSGHVTGCGSYFSYSDPETWFVLYIPLALLEIVYPVDYALPITHKENPWTSVVDENLALIGMRLYRQIPFELGVLGEEVAGISSPDTLTTRTLLESSGLLVPESLFVRRNVSPHGTSSPVGLWWTGGGGARA